jgi:hypothetical protein
MTHFFRHGRFHAWMEGWILPALAFYTLCILSPLLGRAGRTGGHFFPGNFVVFSAVWLAGVFLAANALRLRRRTGKPRRILLAILSAFFLLLFLLLAG